MRLNTSEDCDPFVIGHLSIFIDRFGSSKNEETKSAIQTATV